MTNLLISGKWIKISGSSKSGKKEKHHINIVIVEVHTRKMQLKVDSTLQEVLEL